MMAPVLKQKNVLTPLELRPRPGPWPDPPPISVHRQRPRGRIPGQAPWPRRDPGSPHTAPGAGGTAWPTATVGGASR